MKNSILWNWANYLSDRPRVSYSMAGEDQVLFHIIKNLDNDRTISWLNIGAAHPIILNDTYLFYRSRRFKVRGERPYGISIDARPHLRLLYKFLRRREIFINCLISDGDFNVQDFFIILTSHTIQALTRIGLEVSMSPLESSVKRTSREFHLKL